MDKSIGKVKDEYGWYSWFAWHPVMIEDKIVWLKKVMRKDWIMKGQIYAKVYKQIKG